MRTIIVASAIALLPCAAGAQSPSASKVYWLRIAQVIVDRWQLQPGERAVLFWERTADRGMAAALRTAILARGGVVAGEIDTADPRDDEAWAKTFAKAEVAIWLPGNARFDDRPFEHLVERNPRVRAIHLHWFLPPDAALHDRVDAMYAEAIAVPPETLRKRQAALEKKLRGAKVRITTPTGPT